MPDSEQLVEHPTREMTPEEREDTRTEEQKAADAEKAAEHRAVIRREAQEAGIAIPARLGWDPAQVEAIRKTVAKEAGPAELVMFLEIAARYELDPFAGQIYCAKMGKGDNARIAIIVSRDGLLAFAHKQPDFESMVGDVLHKNDHFRIEYDADGQRKVSHSYEGWDERGDIVGAWCIVKRKGHGATYFFAPWIEYQREGESSKNPWKSYPSAMILKVAESYALRKAFSISGVVGEDEIERERRDLTALPEEPEWGDDELGERLRDMVEQVREIDPGQVRPRKVQARLAGASQEQREDFARELEEFLEAHPHQGEIVDDSTPPA